MNNTFIRSNADSFCRSSGNSRGLLNRKCEWTVPVNIYTSVAEDLGYFNLVGRTVDYLNPTEANLISVYQFDSSGNPVGILHTNHPYKIAPSHPSYTSNVRGSVIGQGDRVIIFDATGGTLIANQYNITTGAVLKKVLDPTDSEIENIIYHPLHFSSLIPATFTPLAVDDVDVDYSKFAVYNIDAETPTDYWDIKHSGFKGDRSIHVLCIYDATAKSDGLPTQCEVNYLLDSETLNITESYKRIYGRYDTSTTSGIYDKYNFVRFSVDNEHYIPVFEGDYGYSNCYIELFKEESLGLNNVRDFVLNDGTAYDYHWYPTLLDNNPANTYYRTERLITPTWVYRFGIFDYATLDGIIGDPDIYRETDQYSTLLYHDPYRDSPSTSMSAIVEVNFYPEGEEIPINNPQSINILNKDTLEIVNSFYFQYIPGTTV